MEDRNDLARRESRAREAARRLADPAPAHGDPPERREPEQGEGPETRRVQEEQRLRSRADEAEARTRERDDS